MICALPAFLEVAPHGLKPIMECDYAEFLAARNHEKHPLRRSQLDEFLRINGAMWKALPLVTVEDMIER